MKACVFALFFSFFAAPFAAPLAALGEEAKSGAGAPLPEGEQGEQGKQGREVRKVRPLPFNSVIYSIDEEHRAFFHMGKKRLRKVYLTPDTRLLLASGEVATVEDLRVGAEVRGSTRKREDGHLDAVTVKIGAKERQ